MFLARRLFLLAAGGAVIGLFDLTAMLMADAALLLGAAVDVVFAPAPTRLVHRREHPPVVAVQRPAEIRLHVQNRGGRRVRVRVRDLIPRSLSPSPDRLNAVVGPAPSSVAYRIVPSRRGRFALEAVAVRAEGPLGLAGRQRTVPVRSTMKVYPTLRGREQIEGRLRRSRLLESGTRSAMYRGGGLEFDSLREYHPDDEFRRINWVATARAGKAISNVHREERNQQVLLLLDVGRTMAASVAGAPRFEHALDAAIAVASLGVTVGDRVGAFAFRSRVVAGVPPRSDPAQPSRILDALFDVEPQVAAADYLGALGSVLHRFRRRALLVLFTDLSDEAALDPLLRTVPILAWRHLVVVAEVRDPELGRLSRSFPDAAAAAYRKAAAGRIEELRDRAARRLTQLGAWVVDRPPDELPLTLADMYLRAKSFGRL